MHIQSFASFLSIGMLSFLSTFGQSNHALIVAVGDYPVLKNDQRSWIDLSSINDYQLIQDLLLKQNFEHEKITALLDAKATAANLHFTFDSILTTLSQGDVFYFHYSGHGQQVIDADQRRFPKSKHLRKDEEDGLDEALALYKAPIDFTDNYELEEHFIDDQLSYYLDRIRERIGPMGQVVVVIDACHSGTSTRGLESSKVRGTNAICAPKGYKVSFLSKDLTIGFDADFEYGRSPNQAKMFAFFGCKATQANYEISENGKNYGSLSYYFASSVLELKNKASYQNLYSKINGHMLLRFHNKQHPVIEGDNLDELIFNGGLVRQQPFFNVLKFQSRTKIKIDGGILNGVQLGDSVGLYANSALSSNESEQICIGVVSEVDAYSATVFFTSRYLGALSAAAQYRCFITDYNMQSNKLKLNLDIHSRRLRKVLENYFKVSDYIELVQSEFDYQIVDSMIDKVPHAIIYLGSSKRNPLKDMGYRPMNNGQMLDSFNVWLKQSARTDIFRRIDFSSPNVSLEVRTYRCLSKCHSDNPVFDTIPVLGNFQINANSPIKIDLLNSGTQEFFINILEILPSNELIWVDHDNPSLRNIKLYPGKSTQLKLSLSQTSGLLEQWIFIASDKTLSLNALEEDGKSLARGFAELNPLLDFVDKSTQCVPRGGNRDLNTTVRSISFEVLK